jgi:precorrin-6x reductase
VNISKTSSGDATYTKSIAVLELGLAVIMAQYQFTPTREKVEDVESAISCLINSTTTRLSAPRD